MRSASCSSCGARASSASRSSIERRRGVTAAAAEAVGSVEATAAGGFGSAADAALAADDATRAGALSCPPHCTAAIAAAAPTSTPPATASGHQRAREALVFSPPGPNTSSAALSTIVRSTRALPDAYAPSNARSHSRLMRRGTPRVSWWMRRNAALSNGSAAFRPATARRCAMYCAVSFSDSASRW